MSFPPSFAINYLHETGPLKNGLHQKSVRSLLPRTFCQLVTINHDYNSV